ncbi:GLPGLI family protein [Elizabethkingia ursingii]|uniref:GLPGLI family protein n=1 Tax=Elizabethkingia ursingii TaxID=1756150 RepID=UPI0007514CE2|nr:GLPGLI family protein [Elizabethkingia ursingii]KUY29809.1 hypothetical protein ATB96_17775 [Elizabethkingia ursingii]
MLEKIIKLSILMISFFTTIAFAQSFRFVYSYKSIPDTLKKNNIIEEFMALDIDTQQQKSVFSSLIKIKSDSNMTANISKGAMLFPDSRIRTYNVIEKNWSNKENFLYTHNHSINPILKVNDKRQFTWQVSKEKKEILSYPVQKATTKFGKREWTAWFSSVIPFSDGPYKFFGLPGLILKITDKTNSHSYELVAIEQIAPSSFKMLKDPSYTRVINISLEEYKKELIENRKDPMRHIRQKVFRKEVFFNSKQRKAEYLKENEIRLTKEMAENNNPIELDKL